MPLSDGMKDLMAMLSCCTYNGEQHTDILLRECDPAATLRSLTIKNAIGDWLCFNPDEGTKCNRIRRGAKLIIMSPLLAIGSFSHHRACDCVIVINENSRLTLIYADLKSENPTGYRDQFKSTRQFSRYLIGLLEEFYNHKFTICKERYVVFYKKPYIGKTPTLAKKARVSVNSPENALKIPVYDGGTVFFNEILI